MLPQVERGLPDNPYARLVEEAGGLAKIEQLQDQSNADGRGRNEGSYFSLVSFSFFSYFLFNIFLQFPRFRGTHTCLSCLKTSESVFLLGEERRT